MIYNQFVVVTFELQPFYYIYRYYFSNEISRSFLQSSSDCEHHIRIQNQMPFSMITLAKSSFQY